MFSDDSLHVELDQKSVVPGDAITGRIVLELKSTRKCTILVELGWRTTGRGNTNQDTLITQEIFTGELEPGIHSFPFELRAPNGPFSYQGVNMTLEWFVAGRADIPWKTDPKASATFTLNHGPVDGKLLYPLADGAVSSELLQEPKLTNFIVTSLGVFLICAGVYLIFTLYFFIKSLIVFVFGVILTVSGIRTFLAKTRLENIQLAFDPPKVRGGEHVRWRATYTPKAGTVINQAKVTFSCREIVISGGGKNKTVRDETVYYWEETLPLREDQTFEGTFEVPHLYSLALESHKLCWNVGFHIDIAQWPDYDVKSEFLVYPPLKQLTTTPPITNLWGESRHSGDQIW